MPNRARTWAPFVRRVDGKAWGRAHSADALLQVRTAEQMGFEIAWFAEHHFSNYCLCPSPLTMAAFCAGKTSRIRLGTGVIVVPLYHVARLLEEIALVDILSGGRLVAGLGTGYQEYEFARFAASLEDSKKHFMEFLDVLEMAFTEGRYGYDGTYIKLPETPIAIRPVQEPLPQIYVAGLYGDRDVQRRVIESGYVPFATAGWRPAEFLAQFRERYRNTCESLGQDPASLPFAVQRYVYVTESREDARDAAERIRYTGRIAMSMRFKYFELDGPMLRDLPAKDEPSIDQIVDNTIIGNVETCIEKAIREIEVLNPTHMSLFMQFGGLSIERTLSSMELFGAEVMPALEKHFGGLERVGNPVPPLRPRMQVRAAE